MEFDQKILCEIDLFDFTSFFWTGLFQIFWLTVCSIRYKTLELDIKMCSKLALLLVLSTSLDPIFQRKFFV